MANILFASNNIAHFPGSVAGSDTSRYSSARVPYSIRLSNYQIVNSPKFNPAAGDETWFHFRGHWYSTEYGNQDRYLIGYDANDNVLFDLRKTPSQWGFRTRLYLYDGATSQYMDSTINYPDDLISTVDVRYKQTTLTLEVDLYINGGLAASRVYNSNPNGYGNPVRFALGTGFTDNLSDYADYSEIIVADADTRNARLDLLRPTAAGAYEQWLGQLATLADDDSTSGITTIDADQRHTMIMSAYGGAPNISNVVAVSSTTRGQNSPTQLQHSVRLSGVDYDGPLLPIDFPLEYHLTDFGVNPATSLAWNDSDVAAVEVGFVSRA